MHDADRLDQPLARRVLEQEASGARSQRAEDVFVEVECREHEHSGRRLDCAARQLRCRLDSIHVGHADVHQDDVGSQLAHAVDRLPAVGSLADDLEPGLRVEEQSEAGAHELLVVDDQHADAHASPPTGSRAATRKPPPARRPASSSPPSSATRSRMPTSPWPGTTAFWRCGAPSSMTSRSRRESWKASVTTTRSGCACLSTFVSASWTMR